MKKLKMIVTSVVVLAIVGSAFAFNAQKKATFCTSGSTSSTTCNTITGLTQKRITSVPPAPNAYYVVDWDGVACSTNAADTHICTVSAQFVAD